MRDAYRAINKIPADSIWVGERSISAAEAHISNLLRRLKNYLLLLALWTMGFGASAYMYAKLSYPDFIASTQVLLQPHFIVSDGPENIRHFFQSVLDSDQCETELRVLSSQQMLYQVFTNLGLKDAPEAQQGSDGLWAFLDSELNRLQGKTRANVETIEAFNSFRGRMRARRLGLSYVIEISYRARSPERATKIVNAIASTYAAYRLRGVLAREQRRGAYLASRLSSLSDQIMAAEAGSHSGVIPVSGLPDADVRLLGPANHPFGIAYPKTIPLVLMMAGLGLVSGVLIILLSRGAPLRHIDLTDVSINIQRA